MLFLNKYVSGLYPDSHKKHPLRCNAADVFYVKGGLLLTCQGVRNGESWWAGRILRRDRNTGWGRGIHSLC